MHSILCSFYASLSAHFYHLFNGFVRMNSTIQTKNIILKKEFIDNAKKSEIYQKVLKIFPDAELIDIDIIKEKNDD